MKTIGICGKIGCGKSAVGVFLEELGAFVLDLDREMHSLYETSGTLREKIADRFGAECLLNGVVDRAALASRVFRDPSSLSDLERMVYPLLRERVEGKLTRMENSENPPTLAAVEGALLFKWPEFSKGLSEIWVVEAPESVRLKRLLSRGLSKEDALRRIKVQESIPLPPNGHYEFIDNSGTMTALKSRVEELSKI